MPIEPVNIGTVANDRTGDPLRTAFDKINNNFAYLDERIDELPEPGESSPTDTSWESATHRYETITWHGGSEVYIEDLGGYIQHPNELHTFDSQPEGTHLVALTFDLELSELINDGLMIFELSFDSGETWQAVIHDSFDLGEVMVMNVMGRPDISYEQGDPVLVRYSAGFSTPAWFDLEAAPVNPADVVSVLIPTLYQTVTITEDDMSLDVNIRDIGLSFMTSLDTHGSADSITYSGSSTDISDIYDMIDNHIRTELETGTIRIALNYPIGAKVTSYWQAILTTRVPLTEPPVFPPL